MFKANTAVNLEGGIAGLINVRLRRPSDLSMKLTIAGGGRVIYGDQARKFDPQGNVLISNRWDTGIGRVGVLINGSYTQAHYLTSVRFDGFRNTPDGSNTVSPAAVGRNFTFPQEIGIFYSRGLRKRPSINGSIQWEPTNDLSFYADGLWQAFRGRGRDDFFGVPIRGGGRPLTNVVLSTAETPDGIPEAQSLTTVLNGTNGPSKNTSNVDTDTYQGAVGGSWETGPAKLSFDVAYTQSTVVGSQINFDSRLARPVTVNADFDVGYGVDFELVNFDSADPANYLFRGSQQRTRTVGKSLQARVDGVFETGISFLPTIDLGFRYSDREANATAGSRFAGQGDLNIPLTSVPGYDGYVIPPGFRGRDIQQFRNWTTIDPEVLRASVPQYLDFVRANNARRPSPTADFFQGDVLAFDPLRTFDAGEQVYAGLRASSRASRPRLIPSSRSCHSRSTGSASRRT